MPTAVTPRISQSRQIGSGVVLWHVMVGRNSRACQTPASSSFNSRRRADSDPVVAEPRLGSERKMSSNRDPGEKLLAAGIGIDDDLERFVIFDVAASRNEAVPVHHVAYHFF